MTISKANIYNLALIHLGVSATIQNTSQNDAETTVLNNLYDIAKVQVLSDFDWNFARKYLQLTPSAECSPDINFKFAFDYPNDCVATRYVIDAGGNYKKYDVATDSKGNKIILCNISPAALIYTRNISSEEYAVPETFFTADFVMCLSFYLASLAALAITGSETKNKLSLQKYNLCLNNAKVNNANEFAEKDEDNRDYTDYRN